MQKELLVSLFRFLIYLMGCVMIFLSFLYLLSNIGKVEFSEFNFYDYLPFDKYWSLLILIFLITLFLYIYIISWSYSDEINKLGYSVEISKIKTSMTKIFAISFSICGISYFYASIPSITTNDKYIAVVESALSDASDEVALDIKNGNYSAVKNNFIDENFVSGPVKLSVKSSEVIEKLVDMSSVIPVEFRKIPTDSSIKVSGNSGFNLISDNLSGYPLIISDLASPGKLFQSKNLISTLGPVSFESQMYFETDIVLSNEPDTFNKPDNADKVCIKVGISPKNDDLETHYVDKCFNHKNELPEVEYTTDENKYRLLGDILIKIPQEYNEGFSIYVYLHNEIDYDYKLNMDDFYNFEWAVANSSLRINDFGSLENINSYCTQGYHDALPSKIFHINTDNVKDEKPWKSELLSGPCP